MTTYPPPSAGYGPKPASPERSARIACAVVGVLAAIGILVVGLSVSDAAPSGQGGVPQGVATGSGSGGSDSGDSGDGAAIGGSSSGSSTHLPAELETNFPFPPGNDDVEAESSGQSTQYLVAGTPTSVRAFYAKVLPTYGVAVDGSQVTTTVYRFTLVYPAGDTRSGSVQIESSGPDVTAGHVVVETIFE